MTLTNEVKITEQIHINIISKLNAPISHYWLKGVEFDNVYQHLEVYMYEPCITYVHVHYYMYQ